MNGFKNGNGNNSKVKKLRPDASPKPEDVKAELFRLRGEITKLVEKDPVKAASLLTQWLNAQSSSQTIGQTTGQTIGNSSTNSRKKAG